MRRNTRNFQIRPNRGIQKRASMLDRRRLTVFLYYAKEIILPLKMDESIWNPLLSSIVAKASRMGIDDAEEFIIEKVGSGELPKEAEAPLIELLHRFSKMR